MGVRCLPQGDAWSAFALAATLTPVARRLRRDWGPALVLALYADDRTGAGSAPAPLRGFLAEWEAYEAATAMRGNEDKRQCWGTTARAQAALQAEGLAKGAVRAGLVGAR